MEKKKVIIVGPAHPYRGGLAAYNERLAREFASRGDEVQIVTFTLQYPSFLFPGKTQYSSEAAPEGLGIVRRLNSVNPFNWIATGRMISRLRPDLVIMKYWTPYMAPCLGTVARIVRRGCGARVVSILDNVTPHERRPGDRLLSKYFCSSVDGFIAMSESVLGDLGRLDRRRPRMLHAHPLYDNFGTPVDRDEACAHLGLDTDKRYLLFFGLIRDYKGLDLLIEALEDKELRKRRDFRVIVAGEFYADPDKYLSLARDNAVDDKIIWRTEFIPDSEVKYYFSVAEMVVQPYKTATQSGVTQIAYQFDRPMLVTSVGGLPEMVPAGRAGYVVAPQAEEVAEALVAQLEHPADFSEGLREEKKKYSWASLCDAIERIAYDHQE